MRVAGDVARGARAPSAPPPSASAHMRRVTGAPSFTSPLCHPALTPPPAASDNLLLKVKGDSKLNSIAGAVCHVVRESANGQPPAIVATGPAAINQARQTIAIARASTCLRRT